MSRKNRTGSRRQQRPDKEVRKPGTSDRRGSRTGSAEAAALLDAAQLEAGERVLDLGWQDDVCTVDSVAESWFFHSDVRQVRLCEAEILKRPGSRAHAVLGVSPGELDETPFDVVLYRPPRWAAKARVFQLFDDAFTVMVEGGRLCLAGRRDGGVESYRKRLEAVFGNVDLAKPGGGLRVYRALKTSSTPGAKPVDPGYRFDVEDLPGGPYVFQAEAGVFSRDGLDRGTRFLIDTLEIRPQDRVLDLGCGYGALGIFAARQAASVVLLDTNLQAVRCAQRNVEENEISNATVKLSDGCEAVEGEVFDLVASNPPTHEGVDTARQFARGVARNLHSDGQFLVVVMRPKFSAKAMRQAFDSVEAVGKRDGFTILKARSPKGASSGGGGRNDLK